MQGILLQIRYFERGLSKRFRTSVCHSHVLVCHPYVTRIYSNAIRMSLVLTRTSFVCHSYVLVCHPYVTHIYSYVIRMSLVWTRMQSVCHSYVLVYHSYVTRMYTYVIRMSLVCICMPSVGHSYVLVCHLYVARIYLYAIRMSLVCTRMSSVCHSYVVLPWTLMKVKVTIQSFLLHLSRSVNFAKYLSTFQIMVLISIMLLYSSSNKLHSVHPSLLPGRGGEFEPSTKFLKRRGLTGSQSSDLRISEGGFWEKNFLGWSFYIKNKLKSEIFTDKKGL